MSTPRTPAQKAVRAIAAVALIASVILTSFNVYPLNLVFGIASNVIWTFVAISLRETALAYQQVVLLAIYAGGLITWKTGFHFSSLLDYFSLIPADNAFLLFLPA